MTSAGDQKTANATASPLVSVVIPAYNAAPVIQRAIESARGQDYPNIEIIVVDDGSTDATAHIVASITDSRIQVTRLHRNAGQSAALNEGIRQSNGEYVAFLDADDEWLPQKLSRQMAKLLSNDRYAFVMCENNDVYSDGRTVERTSRVVDSRETDPGNRIIQDADVLVEGPYAWKTLLFRSYVATPTVLAPKRCLLQAGGFDESLPVANDQDMWIRLALTGEVGCVAEPLAIVHKTAGSLMTQHPLAAHDTLLPLVKRFVAAQSTQLTPIEKRIILGKHYHYAGAALCENGRWAGCVAMLLRSMLMGYSKQANLKKLAARLTPPFLLRRARRGE